MVVLTILLWIFTRLSRQPCSLISNCAVLIWDRCIYVSMSMYMYLRFINLRWNVSPVWGTCNKATCSHHWTPPKRPFLGQIWPMARPKEVKPLSSIMSLVSWLVIDNEDDMFLFERSLNILSVEEDMGGISCCCVARLLASLLETVQVGER